MVYDSLRQRVALFGGSSTDGNQVTYFSDTWEWDGEYWTQVADTGPSGRLGHAMVYDSATSRVVLQGGGGSENPLAPFETWEWDGETWTHTESGMAPGFRSAHAMAYDEARTRVVLFGGLSSPSADPNGETWERTDGIWARVASSGPAPRLAHAMAWNGERVILFGGMAGGSPANDTWQWDGRHWTQRGFFGPRPRLSSPMAYDNGRARVVLFGGLDASTTLADTWELAEHDVATPTPT
jgi:hypothetical protein